MAFNWQGYYDLAISLSSDDNFTENEAKMRTAISRLYYYAFNVMLRFIKLEENPLDYPEQYDENKHAWLLSFLESSDKEDYQLIGETLRKLRRYRNNADYETTCHNTQSCQDESFDMSEEFTDMLRTLVDQAIHATPSAMGLIFPNQS